MTVRRRLGSVPVVLAVLLAGLPAAASPPAADAPCAMLPLRDVRAVYPEATAGVTDLTLSPEGIRRCSWTHGAGTLFLVIGSAADDTVADEARSWALTITDPLRSDAATLVRYETLRGVGDEAIAVVERRDAAKGFTQDGAYISVRRGRVLVTLLAPDLARGERADALRRLTRLGQSLVVPRP